MTTTHRNATGPKLLRETNGSSAASDGELLIRYADSQDRTAFDEIVRRYEREIYNYLRKYLGDGHLAEDAFQATFLQLHRKCRQFQPGRALRPWLYRIAMNQANDLVRRNRRHRARSLDSVLDGGNSLDEQSPFGDCLRDEAAVDPSHRLQSAEDRGQIAAAVKSLPDWLKQPIQLVVYRGLKYADAAKTLGIPLGTLKSRLYEAVRRVGRFVECPSAA